MRREREGEVRDRDRARDQAPGSLGLGRIMVGTTVESSTGTASDRREE